MSTTPAGSDPAPDLPHEPVSPAPQDAAGTAADHDAAVTAARRRRLGAGALGLAAVVLVVDQLTKWWALATLSEGERVPLLGDLLGLTLVFNPGAALSFMANGYTWVLTIVVVAVVVVILRAMRRIGSVGWAVALGLLLGGALGNLVDRLLRQPGFARGEVVDMIAYADLFVGNVADIAIVVAAGMIILLTFRGIGLDGSRHTEDGD
ncbi:MULTISPECIES: signal peptidase II [unclassified Isoptericola]|uniref:signal peptidase II n=1 Tax=unclassified Isoptericola TaxID=2623355 RepID=UPI0027122BB2|nr:MULTISPECIES: signal peptidase II [unclassified Isoptericola]MDO8144677.1 signal peptidase II [Isoptericola sp. 178]MDO8148523.1 signal peptidase II [Isoptericola sp. b515]MDO8152002.1 signal peptidase II [Isoptericola sp. b408]